jgi:uncharacterized protein (DUF2141 family)
MKGRLARFGPIITIMILIVGSCAKQAMPTGGLKDTKPPKLVKSIPPKATVNYKGKNVIVTFDEYFVLDKINEKFMVSPPMKLKPAISVRGKNLIVEFKEPLKDSTTYTLYFQDAVKDLNEGNPLNNFQFVFSTGKIIDSLSLTGNVYNSNTLEAEKNILVLMYRAVADSAPQKMLPDYLSQTDLNGGFRINNIKEGKYKLYSLKDNNNNNKYDINDEAFAFLDSVLEITPTRNYLPEPKVVDTTRTKLKKPAEPQVIEGEHKLYLFTAGKKMHYLSSSDRKLPYQLIYTLSLPPDTSKFEFNIQDSGTKDYFIEKNPEADTLIYWLRDSTLYSKKEINTIISYPFTDTTGRVIYKRDTLSMLYLPGPVSRGKGAKNTYKYATNIQNNSLTPGLPIIISSQTPFRQPDTSRIKLYESKISAKNYLPYFLVKDSSNSRRYFLNAALKEGRKYILITDSAAFGNIYGDFSDSTGISFTVRTENSYGQLNMNILNGQGDLIIQLLDDKEKLLAERKLKNKGLAEFPFLEKGKYRIRIVYDLNGDGKWTTGDFALKRQPEPVSYFPNEIEIRINFLEIEDWDVGKKNIKNQKLRSTGV